MVVFSLATMAAKKIKNGAMHLGLHLKLTAEEAPVFNAMVAAAQKRAGAHAKVTVSSFVLGLIREAMPRSRR